MEDKIKDSVCTVVVTYNRKQLLLECLEALRKQGKPIQAIYLIDNASTDGTPQTLLENGYIQELPPKEIAEPWEKEFKIKNLTDGQSIKLHYVRMHENTGGAGGFYEGVKRGYEKGYDWLWLMDDDVEPLTTAIANMIKYSNFSKCIHPSKKYINGDRFFIWWHIDEDTGFEYKTKNDSSWDKDEEYVLINYGCFEGMLIHRNIVYNIGYPDKKLFFIADDTIYGYLASKFTNNICIKDICFIKKIDKKCKILSNLELYLYFRNKYIYVSGLISKNKFKRFLKIIFVSVDYIVRSILFLKFYRIIPILKGIYHGIFKIWGREKDYLKK